MSALNAPYPEGHLCHIRDQKGDLQCHGQLELRALHRLVITGGGLEQLAHYLGMQMRDGETS